MSYQIRNWDKHYESNDTRKLKSLHWVKLPNQHDSLPFKLIMRHPRGAEIFAAWVLIVQVASKSDKENRGKILMSPDELSIVTGLPSETFDLAIEFLKTPKIGWIEQSPGNLPESPDASGFAPGNLPLKEGKKEGRKEEKERTHMDARSKLFKTGLELFGTPVSVGAELKHLRQMNELADLGATAEELKTRADHYRLCWPDVAFTLQAVLNNWATIPTLKPKGKTNGTDRKTSAQRRDAEAEQFLRELGGKGQADRSTTETDGDFTGSGNAVSSEVVAHGS